VNAALFDRALL
jgi:hypothetical protein